MKTLKDLCREEKIKEGFIVEGFKCNFPLKIKHEAIEWIKYFDNGNTIRHKRNQNTIDWIKHFFVIKDEELK